jgi:Co/Zn/Cd efflux system component
MAMLDHHDHLVASDKEQRHCAMMFCLTWVGFFAAIGIVTYLASML